MVTVARWGRFEASVTNDRRYADPFRDVTLNVTYTRPDGRPVEFRGFHDGGTTWRLRFMPDEVGTWRYEANAQETLWPGNKHHVRSASRDYTAADVRKNAFVIMMSAAALNFGDMDGDSSSGLSGSMELSDRRQELHDAVKGVWDFFESLPFHRMRPRQDLVDVGFCLAEEGEEGKDYLVYLPRHAGGGEVSVKVAGGVYDVVWVNAEDPADRRPSGTTADGKGLASPAEGNDWLVHLTRRAEAP